MNNFKLRAECVHDLLGLTLQLDKSKVSSFEFVMPDELEISCEYELDEVRENIRQIKDGHVMLQTVRDIKRYTGIRDYEIQ